MLYERIGMHERGQVFPFSTTLLFLVPTRRRGNQPVACLAPISEAFGFLPAGAWEPGELGAFNFAKRL